MSVSGRLKQKRDLQLGTGVGRVCCPEQEKELFCCVFQGDVFVTLVVLDRIVSPLQKFLG